MDAYLEQPIIEPLQEIIERRKYLSGLNDSMMDIPFDRLDYFEAQLLPYHHLSEREKLYIMNRFPMKNGEYHFVDYVLHMQPPQGDYQKRVNINTPFRLLVQWFQNRKSKKVQFARNELQQRYLYLDPEDQLTVRLIFLQSPILTDQEIGLRYCFEAWDGKEFNIVQSIWNRESVLNHYTLWFLASKLLIRHGTIDFVKSEQQKLLVFDGKHISSLYFYVALRLINDDSFVLQKELLHIEDYYRLLYHTHQQISVTEWENDIYQVVADIYIHNTRCSTLPYRACGRAIADVRLGGSRHLPDYTYPQRILIPVTECSAWNQAKCRNKHLIEMPTIRQMLLYGSSGGLYVQPFIDYANRVDETIANLYGTEAKSCNGISGWDGIDAYEEFVLKNIDMRCPAAEELYLLCPQKYRHFFEERIIEHEQEIHKLINRHKNSNNYEN